MKERIDKYINGKMTAEEVLQFRKDLNTDLSLREEYEKAKEISDAIQRNALKNIFQNKRSNTSNSYRNTLRKVTYSVGAAASIVMFVLSGSSYLISNNLKRNSAGLYGQLEAPISRSANVVDEILEEAYKCIGIGDIEAAEKKLNAVDNAIADQKKEAFETIEEKEYNEAILDVQQQEAEWYRALLLMREGKVYKSKRALKQILEANGIYSDSARDILENKFGL